MAAVTRRQYKGAAASTTTSSSLSISDTSVTLTAITGWPTTAAVPFYVVIDPGTSSEEKCSATISGSTLTLTRGQDDTTAVAHSSGATIYPVFSADEADEANLMASTMTTKGDLLVTTGSAFNRLAVGSDGAVLMADSAQTNGVAWVGNGLSNRNAIINGAFDIWQRGTSIAYGVNATVYHADRWASIRVVSPSGATISRQPSSFTGFQYCARVQRDSGNTTTAIMYFGTGLESADSYRFAGKTVTLSYYARAGANYSPTSSALSAFITTGTGTDQNFITGFTGATNAGTGVATLTTSWQRFTITATVASNITQISANYSMTPVGTAGANDYYEITGVQLEAGSVATPFEFEDYGTTLAKCQRYFYQVPDGLNEVISNAFAYQNTEVDTVLQFPTTMRTTPTLVQTTGTNYFGFIRSGATDNFNSFALAAESTPAACWLYNNSEISGTAGQAGLVCFSNALAKLGFSAEL